MDEEKYQNTTAVPSISTDLSGGDNGTETPARKLDADGEEYTSSAVINDEKGISDAKRPADDIEDPFLVTFSGPDDPLDPHNFAVWKRWLYVCVLGSMCMCVTFASTIFSTATMVTAEEFSVSPTVTTLGTGLFILGFAVGPPVFGPLSELYGRRLPLFGGWILFVIFQVPVAVAQNIETVLVCRFFGGVMATAPIAVMGGLAADLFDPVRRGLALDVLSATTFIGPILGPVVGGFVTDSYLGWRWNLWLIMIAAAACGILGFFVLPETYGPVILQQKAHRLRHETKNWALHSKLDESPVNLNSIVTRYLFRPFRMLLLEPILVFITLHVTFIYGFIYLLFEAYPVSYQEERGWSLGVSGLPFIAVGLGVVIFSIFVWYYTLGPIAAEFKATGRMRPETRLVPMMVGAVSFPIGCFWLAWTSFPTITPWGQIMAGIPIGIGIQSVLLQGISYIVDVYTLNANSAMAANTMVRSTVAAGFAMFATPMYHNLGVRWASTLLGCLGVVLAPLPWIFYRYGEKLRQMSKYSVSL